MNNLFSWLLVALAAMVGRSHTVARRRDDQRSEARLQCNPKIAHAYMRGEADENGVVMMLMVEPMGGTIGRQRLKAKDIPANIHGEIGTPVKWSGFDLDPFIVHERLNGAEYLTYNVQVPLKSQAIQLKLIGPAAQKAQLEQLVARSTS